MKITEFLAKGRKSPYGLRWYREGQICRKFFETPDHRAEYKSKMAASVAELGASVLDITPSDLYKLQQLREILGDVDPIEAAIFYRKHHRDVRETTIEEGAELYATNQQQRGLDPNHIQHVEKTLRGLGGALGWNSQLHEITRQQISEWLLGLPYAPITIRSYQKNLSAFFNFALQSEWIKSNPANGIKTPTISEAEVATMPLEDVKKLLAYVWKNKPELCAFFALGFFGGLRTSAICRLQLSEIDFEQIGILMPGASHKTRRRHYVTGFPPVLWDWLIAVKAKCGEDAFSISQRNFERWRPIMAERAGIEWPANCMRHTFASCHIALLGSADKTAALLTHRGTSQLYKHYRGKSTRSQAEEYFSLTPETVEKEDP